MLFVSLTPSVNDIRNVVRWWDPRRKVGSNKLRLNKIQRNRAIKNTDKCYNAKWTKATSQYNINLVTIQEENDNKKQPGYRKMFKTKEKFVSDATTIPKKFRRSKLFLFSLLRLSISRTSLPFQKSSETRVLMSSTFIIQIIRTKCAILSCIFWMWTFLDWLILLISSVVTISSFYWT